MLQNFAEDIAFFLLKNKVIDVDESDIYIYVSLGLITMTIASIIIYSLAPVENKNNPVSIEDIKRYKMMSRTITLIIIILTFMVFYIDSSLADFCFMASLTVMTVAILIIISFIRRGY